MAQWQEDSQRLQLEAEAQRLPLPSLLIALRAAGRWHQPTDEALQNAVPFLQGPVDFVLLNGEWGYPQLHLADTPELGAQFHEYRGSRDAQRDLPWIDAEQALFIAQNRVPGDDIGVALDYRTNKGNPRVVASYWPENEAVCHWRLVAETFSDFVAVLEL